MNVRAHLLVPPHFLVSTAFKKMRWKDEFGKWLPKLPNKMMSKIQPVVTRNENTIREERTYGVLSIQRERGNGTNNTRRKRGSNI